MSLPSYTKFIEPLLRYLAEQPDPVTASVAHEDVAEIVGLTEEQKAELVPSGKQTIYKNRIGWANDRLKRAGLSSGVKRGYWELTEKGKSYVKDHPTALTEAELQAIWKVDRSIKLGAQDQDEDDDGVTTTTSDAEESPQERIEHAILELNESVGAELLELIQQSSPTFFEGLVLDLLHSIGYGTSRSDLQRVGGSGDGGIDGIISLDKLGLENRPRHHRSSGQR